ncbi:hypothetical protein ACHAQJ_003331 [Trichoderma viride]
MEDLWSLQLPSFKYISPTKHLENAGSSPTLRRLSGPITDIRIIEALNACVDSQTTAYPNTNPSQNPHNSDSNYFDSVSYASTPRTFNSLSFPSSPYMDSGAQFGVYPLPPPPHPSAFLDNQRTDDDMAYTRHNSLKAFDSDEEDEIPSDALYKSIRRSRPSLCQQSAALRAVRLVGIPDGATYADVAAIIRGGLVYEFYITHIRSTATITFVEVAAAKAYFNYVQNKGIYVNNKRLGIRWLHRHQTINGHHSGRIAKGATRNLVLCNCGPDHTEESIREDLDHIHKLQVVAIEFRGENCHISTNSVANAIKYKSSRIEWDVDGCAQPLSQLSGMPHQWAPSLVIRQRQLIGNSTNRFQLLASEEEW